MSLRQAVAKGMFWTLVSNWGGQSINFLVFLVLARLLAPHDFGLLALATVAIDLAMVFVKSGFPKAIVQRKDLEPEHLDVAFWTGIAMAAIMMVAIFFLASSIANFYGNMELAPVLQCLTLSVLIGSLAITQDAILTRQLKFKSLAIRGNIAYMVGGVVGISAAIMDFGVWSLVAMTLSNATAGVVTLWAASDWRPRFRYSLRHIRELLAFGSHLVGSQLLSTLNRRVDILLAGTYLGVGQLGYYQVGTRTPRILSQLVSSVGTSVMLPTFARIQDDAIRMKSGFFASTRLTSLVSFPIFLGISVLAPELTEILFGPRWMPSIPVLQMFAIVGLLQSMQMFNGTLIISMGKPSWRFYLSIGSFITTAAVVMVSAPYGLGVMVIAQAIRALLWAPVAVALVKKLLQFSWWDYLKNLGPSLMAAVAMVGAILLAQWLMEEKVSVYVRIVLNSVAGGTIYLLTLYALSKKSVHEAIEFVRLVFTRNEPSPAITDLT